MRGAGGRIHQYTSSAAVPGIAGKRRRRRVQWAAVGPAGAGRRRRWRRRAAQARPIAACTADGKLLLLEQGRCGDVRAADGDQRGGQSPPELVQLVSIAGELAINTPGGNRTWYHTLGDDKRQLGLGAGRECQYSRCIRCQPRRQRGSSKCAGSAAAAATGPTNCSVHGDHRLYCGNTGGRGDAFRAQRLERGGQPPAAPRGAGSIAGAPESSTPAATPPGITRSAMTTTNWGWVAGRQSRDHQRLSIADPGAAGLPRCGGDAAGHEARAAACTPMGGCTARTRAGSPCTAAPRREHRGGESPADDVELVRLLGHRRPARRRQHHLVSPRSATTKRQLGMGAGRQPQHARRIRRQPECRWSASLQLRGRDILGPW